MRFKLTPDLFWKCAVSVISLIIIAGAHGQDLEPRAYTNLPVGLNFVLTGYGYSEGGVAIDPSVPLENDILYDENGALLTGILIEVWTGTNPTGTFDQADSNWLNSSSGTFATAGSAVVVTSA